MAQGFTKDYPQTAQGSVEVLVNGTVQESTSGSSITFTIPSGVKKFTLSWSELSTSSTSNYSIRLGDSGGLETTGYASSWARIIGTAAGSGSSTTRFPIFNSAAAQINSGFMEFVLLNAATNLWAAQGSSGREDSDGMLFFAGRKALSGELTTIELATQAGTFDGGSVNIQYENPEPVVAETVYLSGGVVQSVSSGDGVGASGTTTIPVDNTIPQQSTEGNEFYSASITPKKIGNKLRIQGILNCHHSAATRPYLMAVIHRDSDEDALAVGWNRNTDNATSYAKQVSVDYWMDVDSLSSTTFKLFGGSGTAGTFYVNGNGSQIFNGAFWSGITVTEYAA